jgi:pilus assembly protein CpaF
VIIPNEIFAESILGFFAPIRPFLDDESVSEIMINGYDKIFIERRGRLELTSAKFRSEDDLMAALRNLAQFVGRHFGVDRPVLEARFPDGSRVEAVVPPCAPDGPQVAIRRFQTEKLTAQALLDFGSITADALATIRALVMGKQNIMVAGGTASGKTSLLNVVSTFIPDSERVVVIEDARELQLKQSNLVQLEARPPDAKGKGQVSIRDLFKATLRMRPDRIVVGEVRGAEALDLVQAMTSGHGGCLSTVHATHPLDTVNRLETLALMSDVALPLVALRAQVASAINIIVHTARLGDGFRCITHISEVVGLTAGEYDIVDLFERNYLGKTAEGKILSELTPTGALPTSFSYLQSMGVELPAAVMAAARANPNPRPRGHGGH